MALEKSAAAVRRGVRPVYLVVLAVALTIVMLAIVPRPSDDPVRRAPQATSVTQASPVTNAVDTTQLSAVALAERAPLGKPPEKLVSGSPAQECSIDPVAPAREANLVRNSSFEKRLSCWTVPAKAIWESKGGIQDSGGLAIQVERPPDDPYIHETAVTQCVPIGSAERLALQARVKLVGMPASRYANKADIYWYDTADCSTGGEWGAQVVAEVADGWQNLIEANLKPTLTAQAALIRIVQNGRESNHGRAYWDEVSLTPTQMTGDTSFVEDNDFPKGARNPDLNNGEFVDGVQGWHAHGDVEWNASEGDSAPGAARVSARSRAVRVVEFEQCVYVAGSGPFELSGSFKRDPASTGKGSARLRMTWYETSDCHGRWRTSESATPRTDTDGWQRLKLTGLVAPERARSARITIIQGVDGPGAFYADWDDLHFLAVD